MSKAHKAALAQGRVEGRVIRTYLDVLEANRPKRGRKRTIESITRRLIAIRKEILVADTVTKLRLTQERMDLDRELKIKNGERRHRETRIAIRQSCPCVFDAKRDHLHRVA